MSETSSKTKPKKRYTVCVDFDGVLHAYTTPWINAHTIPDPPVPGAIEWLFQTIQDFDVVIFSTRAKTRHGQRAMRRWLKKHAGNIYYPAPGSLGIEDVKISYEKLPALVYIDDRAYRFEGSNWPSRDDIYSAIPWNKLKPRSEETNEPLNAEQTETLEKVLALSNRPDADVEPLISLLTSVDVAMACVDHYQMLSDSTHEKEAWLRLNNTVAAAEAVASTLDSPKQKPPETTLLYAAEVAVNLLRELPGGHGYEIDLLVDAIRNAGGLPDGRDSEGEPI